jgi:CTP synthase
MRLGGRDVEVLKNTKAYDIFGRKSKIRMRFRHRFEVNPKYIETLEKFGMRFSGKAPNYQIMQILELSDRKFFMATQAHPEFNSRPLRPEPLFNNFIKSTL